MNNWGLNDSLMALAAFRYCLGRSSYIGQSCLEWLDVNWNCMDSKNRGVILRDIREALCDGTVSRVYSAEWQAFAESHDVEEEA